jgi:hypothetical protein
MTLTVAELCRQLGDYTKASDIAISRGEFDDLGFDGETIYLHVTDKRVVTVRPLPLVPGSLVIIEEDA